MTRDAITPPGTQLERRKGTASESLGFFEGCRQQERDIVWYICNLFSVAPNDEHFKFSREKRIQDWMTVKIIAIHPESSQYLAQGREIL